MKICIICRIPKGELDSNGVPNFNDEHVIPEAIGGYYHIYSVCSVCNSELGSKIDKKLTDHQIVKFCRHNLKIKNDRGHIPNPFGDTYSLVGNSDQKVRFVIDKEGDLKPELINNVPRNLIEKFNIIIDEKNENEIAEIIDKALSRRRISKEDVVIKKTNGSYDGAIIEIPIEIDIKDFKMGILKIAYEFAVDSIPKYFNDESAIAISKLLKEADFENLYDRVKFIDEKIIIDLISHQIDFENNNHYLVLFDTKNTGLIGLVNLFDLFTIGIQLSNNTGFIDDLIIVGKNDLEEKKFEKLTYKEIHSFTCSPIKYSFEYHLPEENKIIQEFLDNSKHPNFDIIRYNDQIPFFKINGDVAYDNIDDKLNQSTLTKIQHGDLINEFKKQIILDEELYIMLLPIKKLYKVKSVTTLQYRNQKI
jgi:HNH endonuclease